jgi:hypothetical protein
MINIINIYIHVNIQCHLVPITRKPASTFKESTSDIEDRKTFHLHFRMHGHVGQHVCDQVSFITHSQYRPIPLDRSIHIILWCY